MTPITRIATYKRRRKPSLDSLLGPYSGRWLDETKPKGDNNELHSKVPQPIRPPEND